MSSACGCKKFDLGKTSICHHDYVCPVWTCKWQKSSYKNVSEDTKCIHGPWEYHCFAWDQLMEKNHIGTGGMPGEKQFKEWKDVEAWVKQQQQKGKEQPQYCSVESRRTIEWKNNDPTNDKGRPVIICQFFRNYLYCVGCGCINEPLRPAPLDCV